MAIKKLQNDHTSPEQSKRLLELGVPADSANMHYHQECVRMKYGKEEFEYFIRYGKPDTNKYSTDIPCWSAGRLMEIYGICMGVEGFFYCKGNFIDEAVRRIEGSVKNNLLDFSKLEG